MRPCIVYRDNDIPQMSSLCAFELEHQNLKPSIRSIIIITDIANVIWTHNQQRRRQKREITENIIITICTYIILCGFRLRSWRSAGEGEWCNHDDDNNKRALLNGFGGERRTCNVFTRLVEEVGERVNSHLLIRNL